MKDIKRHVYKLHEVLIAGTSSGWQATIYGLPTLRNPRGDIIATTVFFIDSKSAFREARKAINKLERHGAPPH